jgi:hypothetical protein
VSTCACGYPSAYLSHYCTLDAVMREEPEPEERSFERRRLRVYVAGPITKGNHYDNVHRALMAGRRMVHDGLAPYVPHFDAFMFSGHDAEGVGWNAFLEWDLEWVAASDAVYRLAGESKGADLECEVARSLDIPVFAEGTVMDYDALLRYARDAELDGRRK